MFRVGPNAVLQTRAALEARHGTELTRAIFEKAGLLHHLETPPTEMVDQRDVRALFDAILRSWPRTEADAILAESGRLTGEYILHNRIPLPARRLLSALPAPLGNRLLTKAIGKHAWTFCGSGKLRTEVIGMRGKEIRFDLSANPLATPGCPWHLAVFERLFSAFNARPPRIDHAACCARGADTCGFTLHF